MRGLLTATEKHFHLGRHYMRPIQWHLKNNWRVPESLEKVITIPRSLHPHLQWRLQEDRLTITPSKTCSTNLFRLMKRRVGPHLNERTARGTWSLPESKLHISDPDLRAVFLALRESQDLYIHKIVCVATDKTTVVSYINKEA